MTVTNTPAVGTWRESVPLFNAPDTVVAGTWTNTAGSFAMGLASFNSTNAQNDGAIWRVSLSPGTWTVVLWGQQAAGSAIATIDISYNGGNTFTSIGTWDLYAAATNNTFSTTFTGIVVPTAPYCLVRFRALTRNVSNTTGWTLALSTMEWTRTA